MPAMLSQLPSLTLPKKFITTHEDFFSRYQVGKTPKQSNTYKKHGYPVLEIVLKDSIRL